MLPLKAWHMKLQDICMQTEIFVRISLLNTHFTCIELMSSDGKRLQGCDQ